MSFQQLFRLAIQLADGEHIAIGAAGEDIRGKHGGYSRR